MSRTFLHFLFLALCAVVLIVLLKAPPVSTPRLPPDQNHAQPKEYSRCPSCHGADADTAMPEDHFGTDAKPRTDHVKCYFCHKPAE